MSLHNTALSYGPLARALHWLTAALILALIPLGFVAESLAEAVKAAGAAPEAQLLARTVTLFSLHKTLGVALFAVALVRLVWMLLQTRPAPLHPQRRLETFAAEAVHIALYISLVAVPLTGWVHHAASTGFAPIWGIGQSLPFVPKSEAVSHAASTLHGLFVWVLIGTLLAHIGGALKHALIDRDATLARMTRGTPAGVPLRHSRLPGVAAILGWALVPLFATATGLLSLQTTTAPVLEQAQSDWQVQTGTLGITITQMGQPVTGQFTDWTAQISFDPDSTQPVRGAVDVTVSIPSLSLGSVTAQAMGPDFFDATTFPTARFQAEIHAQSEGFVAIGTLSLKDHAIPLSLPFSLTLENGTATVAGTTTTDRRDFAIGAGVAEPGTLAFDVAISVQLTATRP
ncbi:cytochrome [Thalassobius vesicularis]|uniref:Cytochrome n=1 Tax=Thalassobius vesicularis TaxID=1294297 RepID=A0A4S3M979_9RHOB|nr:cytochrome b/b6 domain-containing protein [Thalassobius vesicularis]THD74628.1 cytochrome [Thalassobius vesicularis]